MNASRTTASIQEILQALSPERKGALLDYACFLHEQDAREKSLVKEDEAGWDRQFSDVARLSRFQEWGRSALGEAGETALDLKKL